jgi:hypothetical protein
MKTLHDINVANRARYSRDAAPGSTIYSGTVLRSRNQAIDWMFEHYTDYSNAQMLAQEAATKYDLRVADIIDAAREIFK